jgi:F-type H+-transporting ATPase subunit b
MQYISQSLWAIASFVLVLVILLKKLFPPIVQAMDRRASDIRETLAAAEKARDESKALLAQYEESLEKGRKEALAIIEEGKADASKLRDSILESAKKDAEETVARARRDIEQAKITALDDLTRRSIQIGIELASRLIQKSVSPEEHQALIQETVRKLPAA